MKEKIMEIMLVSLMEAVLWVWFSFGANKTGLIKIVNGWFPEKLSIWCDYCFCFWVAMVVHLLFFEYNHLLLCPMVASVTANIILKIHYSR